MPAYMIKINKFKKIHTKDIVMFIIAAIIIALLLFTPVGQMLLGLFGISTMGVFIAKFLFNILVVSIPSFFSFMSQIASALIIAMGAIISQAITYFAMKFSENYISQSINVYKAGKKPVVIPSEEEEYNVEEENGFRISICTATEVLSTSSQTSTPSTQSRVSNKESKAQTYLPLLSYNLNKEEEEKQKMVQELVELMKEVFQIDSNFCEFTKYFPTVEFENRMLIGMTLKLISGLVQSLSNPNFLPILEKSIKVEGGWNEVGIQQLLAGYIPPAFQKDDFEASEELDEGGHGKVYKSKWKKANQEIVLKTYKKKPYADVSWELFYEYYILQMIAAKDIAPNVYGYMTESSSYTLVMDYVGEKNLAALITGDEESK